MRVVYFPNALGHGRIDAGESEKWEQISFKQRRQRRANQKRGGAPSSGQVQLVLAMGASWMCPGRAVMQADGSGTRLLRPATSAKSRAGAVACQSIVR